MLYNGANTCHKKKQLLVAILVLKAFVPSTDTVEMAKLSTITVTNPICGIPLPYCVGTHISLGGTVRKFKLSKVNKLSSLL